MGFLTLKDRVAIVTGAVQGMGFETAKIMCQHGMSVVMVDINRDKLVSATNELNALGKAEVYPVVCDISDDVAIEKMIKEAIDHFGQLDVVVNCAGILSAKKIPDVTRQEWDKILAVNLSGAFFIIQKVLPYLKNSKAGRVINISSTAGRMGGIENSMSYTASKGGLCAITRGIARQLAPFKITVNAVCPGPTRTPITDAYTEEELRNLNSKNLLGRLGEPEEMAAAICYLASEEAAYVTGSMLDINGGFWMG
jgi:3-oxoacyl-[acyl-carrier protein] reductase